MKKFWIVHPFLFAIYPVLFLYVNNIKEFRLNVLGVPLIIVIVFTSLVFFISRILLRRVDVAAIFTSILTLIFFSYDKLIIPIQSIKFNLSGIFIGPDKVIFLISFLSLILTLFMLFKYKKYLKIVNKILIIVSTILVAFTISKIVIFEIKTGRIPVDMSADDIQSDELEPSADKPDIYYFVLDRYGGEKTLNMYGFDNQDFVNFLKNRGFYIASDATSNYPKTFLSLGSTLNMEYLNYLTEKTNGKGTSDAIVVPLVKNNKVTRFLKSKGYTYIHVGSGWDPTRSNKNADKNYILNGGIYPYFDEFTSGFLHMSIAAPILKHLFPDVSAVSRNPKNNDHRSRVLYQLKVFDEIPQLAGPKFVFVHILLPHDPYVLDKDCEPLTEEVVSSRKNTENYINQLQCTNKKMKIVIDQILSTSHKIPIIIIQPDEGPLPLKYPISSNLSWEKASDDSLYEKFPIFSAYLLPGEGNERSSSTNKKLYPSITPVNSFRIIFNTYFKTNLPLLPDKNYIFKDDDNYYNFTDVTQRLKL